MRLPFCHHKASRMPPSHYWYIDEQGSLSLIQFDGEGTSFWLMKPHRGWADLVQYARLLVPPVRRAAMFRAPRRPTGEARRGRILDVCNRGATKPGGMHRRPDGRN